MKPIIPINSICYIKIIIENISDTIYIKIIMKNAVYEKRIFVKRETKLIKTSQLDNTFLSDILKIAAPLTVKNLFVEKLFHLT